MPNSSANDMLDRLILDAGTLKDSWINRPLDVVRVSYEEAEKAYTAALADQKATDDLQAEIVIMILLVGAGALWAAAPSAAVILGTAGTSAIGRFGTRMRQLFPTAGAAAATFSSATIVKYIWKPLGKESVSMMKKQASDQMKKQLAGGLSSPSLSGASPNVLFSLLKGHIDNVYAHLLEGLKAVRYGTATEQQKHKFAQEVKSSPFLAPVPDLSQQITTLQRRFTLMMFMNLILDADSHGTSRFVYVPIQASPMVVTDYSPISARPLDPDYPKSGKFDYKDTGNKVAKKINELYKAEHGAKVDFMPVNLIANNVNAEVMRKADREARRLSSLVNVQGLIPIAKQL